MLKRHKLLLSPGWVNLIPQLAQHLAAPIQNEITQLLQGYKGPMSLRSAVRYHGNHTTIVTRYIAPV